MTGFPQPQPSAVFSAFASVPQQQAPQPSEQNKFQPANIFANMKQGKVGQSQDAAPQPSGERRRSAQAQPHSRLQSTGDPFHQINTTPYGLSRQA
jgi:hypothetical protein